MIDYFLFTFSVMSLIKILFEFNENKFFMTFVITESPSNDLTQALGSSQLAATGFGARRTHMPDYTVLISVMLCFSSISMNILFV